MTHGHGERTGPGLEQPPISANTHFTTYLLGRKIIGAALLCAPEVFVSSRKTLMSTRPSLMFLCAFSVGIVSFPGLRLRAQSIPTAPAPAIADHTIQSNVDE